MFIKLGPNICRVRNFVMYGLTSTLKQLNTILGNRSWSHMFSPQTSNFRNGFHIWILRLVFMPPMFTNCPFCTQPWHTFTNMHVNQSEMFIVLGADRDFGVTRCLRNRLCPNIFWIYQCGELTTVSAVWTWGRWYSESFKEFTRRHFLWL